MISKREGQTATVLVPSDTELAAAIRVDPLVHIDETPWRQAGVRAVLWLGPSERATHFRIRPKRDADSAREVLGSDEEKVVICDRSSASTRVTTKQWCWRMGAEIFRR